ncbi:MAG: hypothetical protein ABW048_05250 [Sphingobium sp.]
MLTDNRTNLSWLRNGYAISYKRGETNHCPGCGRHNWIVGRLMAECAFCGTALTLMHIHGYGAAPRFSTHGQSDETLPPEMRAVA